MSRSLDISIHGVDRVGIIERLVHVCRYSPGLVLLDGVAGKSPVNFLLHMSELLRDELDLALLRSADITIPQICTTLISHWYIYQLDDVHQTDIQCIHHFLDVSSQTGKLSLIVVERASLLDDQSVGFLIALMARHSQLTVLLAGVVDAKPFLRRAQQAEVPVSWIELPDVSEHPNNLSDSGVVSSVAVERPNLAMNANFFEKVSPEPPLLSDLDIFNESGFFTGTSVASGFSAVDGSDEFVVDFEYGCTAGQGRMSSGFLDSQSRNDSRSYWALGVLSCAFILGFLLFRNQFDTSESVVESSSAPSLSVTIPASGAYPPIIGVPSGNIGGSDSVTTPTEPVVSAPPPFIDYPASVDTEKAAPDGATQQKIAEIRDNAVSKSGRRKEDGAEVIRTVRGAPPPTVLAKSTILPTKATKAKSVLDVRTAENRWRSKPDNYTVQIASSHGVVAIKTLAEKLPSEQPHFIYLASRDGKPWYVLIYGSFGSKVEANSARAALVAKIDTGSSPWVRRQGEIFVH